MALNSYLAITGSKQGEIAGSATAKGKEKQIEVIGFGHEIVSPRDAASGLPTGKRQHKPFVITKPVDKSTPLLLKALVDNENISDWRLNCWRAGAGGKEEQFYTIQLVNATIAGVRQEMLNNRYEENQAHEIREHVTFTYQKITWTWTDGGITALDDWEAAPNI